MRCTGLSLLELLAAIAIFSLVLGFGVPSYRDWIAARQLANHAEYLVETLNQARSEAVKRQSRVNLCKSIDGRQCAAAGSWSAGWIMFEDDDHDGNIDAAERIIRLAGPAGNGITVTANHPLESYVSYTNFGYARLLNGALQMGTFVVCKPGQQAIDVVLANSGRVRLSRTRRPCP
ncbi:MAG TPA: GspH/FimT family pseudopilin [Casimicrobiaceae bacterium]|nr:GspH/FimT family pseudopilin [Casimicrobiaceae bacterium]